MGTSYPVTILAEYLAPLRGQGYKQNPYTGAAKLILELPKTTTGDDNQPRAVGGCGINKPTVQQVNDAADRLLRQNEGKLPGEAYTLREKWACWYFRGPNACETIDVPTDICPESTPKVATIDLGNITALPGEKKGNDQYYIADLSTAQGFASSVNGSTLKIYQGTCGDDISSWNNVCSLEPTVPQTSTGAAVAQTQISLKNPEVGNHVLLVRQYSGDQEIGEYNVTVVIPEPEKNPNGNGNGVKKAASPVATRTTARPAAAVPAPAARPAPAAPAPAATPAPAAPAAPAVDPFGSSGSKL